MVRGLGFEQIEHPRAAAQEVGLSRLLVLGVRMPFGRRARPRPSRKVAPEGRVRPLPLEPAPAFLISGRAAFYIAPGAAFVLLHSKHPTTLRDMHPKVEDLPSCTSVPC